MKRAPVHPTPRPLSKPSGSKDLAVPDDSAPGAAAHDEWLLDESLGETFPASDPISPGVAPNPGKGKGS